MTEESKNKIFKIDELNQINSDDSNLVKQDNEQTSFTPFFQTALAPIKNNALAVLNKNQELSVLRYSLHKSRITSLPNNHEETYVLLDNEIKRESTEKVNFMKWHPNENQILIARENHISIWNLSMTSLATWLSRTA